MLEFLPHLLAALPTHPSQAAKPDATPTEVVIQEAAAPASIPQNLATPTPIPSISPPESIIVPESTPTPAPEFVVPTVDRVQAEATPVAPRPQQPLSQGQPNFQSNEAAFEAIKEERKRELEEKLAGIVEGEKPLKEAQLRHNLAIAVISYARAGQFDLARQTAQNPALDSTTQADLLARIDAIAAEISGSDQVIAQPATACQTAQLSATALSGKCNQAQVNTQGSKVFQGIARPGSPRTFAPKVVRNWGVSAPAINTVRVGPISLGRIVPPGTTTPSSRDYYNRSIRPAGRLGNGNLNLLFPLPIPTSITSAFGWRVHPITGDRRFHSGTDLGAPLGTPVLAAYAGKVAIADFMGGYGLAVALDHNKGTQETLYAHLSEIFVKPGEWVQQGAVIGRVGSTGNSTGPHLHFEFRQLTPEGWQAMDSGAQLEYALAQLVTGLQTAYQPSSLNLATGQGTLGAKSSPVIGGVPELGSVPKLDHFTTALPLELQPLTPEGWVVVSDAQLSKFDPSTWSVSALNAGLAKDPQVLATNLQPLDIGSLGFNFGSDRLGSLLGVGVGNHPSSLVFPLKMPAPIASALGWLMNPLAGDRQLAPKTNLGAAGPNSVLATQQDG